MYFKDGQHILLIGDSITDCGRREDDAPYGRGYVSLLRAFTTARHPGTRLTWTNRGISGNTTRHMAGRWEADALAPRPDWLSVMIGINDVWRAFDGHPENAVPLDEYTDTLRTLLRRAVEETGCRLILADPYIIEPDRDEPQRAASDKFVTVVAGLAEEFDAVHIPTQQVFDSALVSTASQDWADDRVHPNLAGHALIAEAFMKALEI
ncbi:SGNH/GDSL hydrolase family protein [Catenulispora sp. NF23]|uniref:SGNH/GDSL hydrolase family protein n=1 Tax=Catenulispora pinistramenti TaxID=2705254 RepID=A0ABS5L7U4_9ACTN|nr:SGNH/GDSL hydrolase family protein [Catenulispora pinistramenti]MBS2539839.1 SGNH/GDSL hydrolase family protein [Catenulispora pinistramenti]MBS2554441.1 SGNH/GDSL hydrolase family protein [Catenulispora pinistramenti]